MKELERYYKRYCRRNRQLPDKGMPVLYGDLPGKPGRQSDFKRRRAKETAATNCKLMTVSKKLITAARRLMTVIKKLTTVNRRLMTVNKEPMTACRPKKIGQTEFFYDFSLVRLDENN